MLWNGSESPQKIGPAHMSATKRSRETRGQQSSNFGRRNRVGQNGVSSLSWNSVKSDRENKKTATVWAPVKPGILQMSQTPQVTTLPTIFVVVPSLATKTVGPNRLQATGARFPPACSRLFCRDSRRKSRQISFLFLFFPPPF